MATIIRPPIVSQRLQKRRIGTPDSYPNLIASTLRNAVLTLSAPLTAEQLDDSASPRKRQVRVDYTPNLLATTLQATTQRLAMGLEQWNDSASPRKSQVRVDLAPNLLGTTLAVVAPAGIPLPLGAEQLDDSAPRTRRLPQLDQVGRAVWRDPVPRIAQLFESSIPRKRQTRIDVTPNPVVLLQPLIRGWFESAPRVKGRVAFDLPANLRTLQQPAAVLAKPLGYPVDLSEPQLKYEVTIDFVPNMLVLGYPDPPQPDRAPRRNRTVISKVVREAILDKAPPKIAHKQDRSVRPAKPASRTTITRKPRGTIH